ncbi:MFS transporter [Streptomyces sp. NPDC096012]|uniref:MFS transporter n=1 Tax=Streptomyces sp. NPDC096012 TaxID=3155684 RepID=UPI00336A51D7
MSGTKPVSGDRAVTRGPRVRAVAAGSVGNLVEWYEFGVYGFLATVLAERFFAPAGGGTAAALVRTYASFALAFFFRPVGAVVFGRLGDRWGRRPVLIGVVSLMSGATALIGVLPTYDAVGALAPWLLTSLRVVQGLAAGGEFGGAVALLTESAPPGRRGLYGAWQSFTVALGLLGGAAVTAVTATVLSDAQLTSWGWRLPFLLALPLGLVALWLRTGLPESPSFAARGAEPEPSPSHLARGTEPQPSPSHLARGTEPQPSPSHLARGAEPERPPSHPVRAAEPEPERSPSPSHLARGAEPEPERSPSLSHPARGAEPERPPSHPVRAAEPEGSVVRLGGGALALAAARVMGWSAAGYTFLVVLPSYLQLTLHTGVRHALLAAVPANAGFAVAILPAGLLSDRVGRRPVLLTGAVLVVVTALPLLGLLRDPGTSSAVKAWALCAAGVIVGLMAGPGPALLAEMFPTRVRWTGLGLAYALSNALFSGCAGLIITEAVRRTGNPDVPALYAAAACAVSAAALLKRTSGTGS